MNNTEQFISYMKEITNLKIDKLAKQFDLDSIKERIKDLEWQLSAGHLTQGMYSNLTDQRKRALDKLRMTSQELLEIEKRILAIEDK